MNKTKQFCTFYLDNSMFGVDVLKVQEVIRFQEMTRVPLAPPLVKGLLNLRGHIVTTIDMRERLGLAPSHSEDLPSNVVTKFDEGLVSLLVDRIGEVLDVSMDDFEPPPETLQQEFRSVISGVYKLETGLMLVLNIDHIVGIGVTA